EDVLVPGAIAAVALMIGISAFCVRMLRRRPPHRRVSAAIVLAPVASFVFIAATAPMPHYAGATFLLIALEVVLIVLANVGAAAAPAVSARGSSSIGRRDRPAACTTSVSVAPVCA